MVIDPELLERVERWTAAEPDPANREEIERLVAQGDEAGLRDRFDHRLQFGTAGLRGALGAGPNRMNRVTVRRAAHGLARYLLDAVPGASSRGVVIGFDARHGSREFASDSARVFAERGLRALALPGPTATPVCAWSVTELGAAAGVMVTASHNPAGDNGYKVYLGDGAQIVPPNDVEISSRIDSAPIEVPISAEDHPLIETVPPLLVDGYLSWVSTVRRRPEIPGVVVASTALHGVGGALLVRALAAAGFPAPVVVDEQQQPDPDFPTVALPNPEEPGAMDRVISLAIERGASMAIATDPDADRLGVAIPSSNGSWRRLSGDEIGWLLAEHALSHSAGDDRLVVTTLVSSSMLERIAARHGVHHLETFTGFKWIARAILDHPQWRFVFGYEQALGYLVSTRPLDKDGISAAVSMVEVASLAAHEGVTLEDRLAVIRATYGDIATGERSIRMDTNRAASLVQRVVDDPPTSLNGRSLTRRQSIPEAGLVRLWFDGTRVQIRPSGTEPKVKIYVETIGDDPAPMLDAVAAWLSADPGQ